MKNLAEFWSTIGWKVAYAAIVDIIITVVIVAAICVGGWWLITMK